PRSGGPGFGEPEAGRTSARAWALGHVPRSPSTTRTAWTRPRGGGLGEGSCKRQQWPQQRSQVVERVVWNGCSSVNDPGDTFPLLVSEHGAAFGASSLDQSPYVACVPHAAPSLTSAR